VRITQSRNQTLQILGCKRRTRKNIKKEKNIKIKNSITMNKYGSQSYRKHFGVIKKEKNIKIK
jgi:hypothetical protein